MTRENPDPPIQTIVQSLDLEGLCAIQGPGAGLGIACGGSDGIQIVGEFKIEPAIDHRASPGDSSGIGDAVGDSRQVLKGTEAARVKYRFAVFSCGDDGFHDSIVGAGGTLLGRCEE